MARERGKPPLLLTLDALKHLGSAQPSPTSPATASTASAITWTVPPPPDGRPRSARRSDSSLEAPSNTSSNRTVSTWAGKTRSTTTGALLTCTAEWWVLRPGREGGSSGSTLTLECPEARPTKPRLEESWCGVEPDSDHGESTKWYERGWLSPMRRRCAGHRTRYCWNGFDLDLTYITSRIIAMGFPGDGTSAAFRNPRSEVARFLNWAHRDHYRIYNLCAEPAHIANGFPDSTVHIPCVDHCPPTLQAFLLLCQDAMEWLAADSKNVIVVHCKAGKGRTGCMICALLLYAGALPSAYEALRWYELMRGGTNSGVTIPGQIRWVAMFERWLVCRVQGLASDPMQETAPPHRLRSVRVGPLRDGGMALACLPGGRPAAIRVSLISRDQLPRKKVTYMYTEKVARVDEDDFVEVSFDPNSGPVWEQHDGVLMVVVKSGGNTLKLRVWWHHAFLQQLSSAAGNNGNLALEVKKEWIDGLHRDVGKDKAAEFNFTLRATFDDVEPSAMRQIVSV